MKKVICFSAILLLLCQTIFSQERFSIEGYYKNFSIYFMLPAYKLADTTINDPDLGAVNNRVRLKLSLHPSSQLSFHFAYELSPRIQDPMLFTENVLFSGFKPLEYRIDDFRERIYPRSEDPTSNFGLFHNLDRFFMTIKTEYADIFIGRQAIAWGNARMINPTDIIVPFAFNELDKEERRGVDAVRVRIPLGMMDELDLGFVAGRNFDSDKNAFFLRGKIYKFQTDISALLVAFRKHLLIGLDLARAIGGAGFWLEAAYVMPHYFKGANKIEENNYLRATIGLDYSLNSKTYSFAEYHFNSAGSGNPEGYTSLFASSAYRDASVYLMGKHYINIGTSYQLSPLIPFTGMLMCNLSDRSFILAPFLEYNIAENIYLAAGGYIGLGKKPEIILGPQVPHLLLLRSEFGTYPDMLFTSFRVYF